MLLQNHIGSISNLYQKSTRTYWYGFNGQEKDDEINGGGNAYTAMFWEYDSRTGRRWNVDPVKKYWQSTYCTFSNNPIIKIDPSGDDDYYDKKGQYLGSDFSLTTNVRIIERKVFETAQRTFNTFSKLPKTEPLYTVGQNVFNGYLQQNSKILTINYKGSDYSNMWNSSKNERGGYFLLDPEKASLSFKPWANTASNTPEKASADDTYEIDGVTYHTQSDLIVIGSIHDHPTQESYYGKMQPNGKRVTDQSSYKDQYSTPDADGNSAITDGLPAYTMSKSNVDLYTKKGYNKNNNNVSSTKNLFSGKFNILKNALEIYGGKNKR